MRKFTILAVDDEIDMLKTFEKILKKKYLLHTTTLVRDAIKMIVELKIDIVLLDIRMPKIDGLTLLRQIKATNPEVEVIIVSASNDIVSAVEAMKAGALDYVAKPFDINELCTVIEKAIEKRGLQLENLYLKEALAQATSFCDLIGKSQIMQNVFETIESVAKTDSRILITGESGTGKELVARAIHKNSQRANHPFIAVNCAAIPDNLLESELFGYEKGAFTGAMERKLGKFELADSGTIFLDEIGCMSSAMQSKLLRVIQDNCIDRVGGNSPISINIRLLAATNLNFTKAIANKTFREDLYYRLNVIPIHLPPLRERKEDIGLFLDYFMNKYNKELNRQVQGFDQKATLLLKTYDWPGNVRELQNIVERLLALSNSSIITRDEVEKNLSFYKIFPVDTLDQQFQSAVAGFEKAYITRALEQNNGNKTQAAKILGMARTTLLSKINALKLDHAT
ncbi:MAG: sigma-54 dependent transcriptional regulator [Candidatus Margulisiibacteriota bacterium]